MKYLKKYLKLLKVSIMTALMHRYHFLFSTISNVLYIVLIYNLWNAIFSNSNGQINGMNFDSVFLYLALAASMFWLYQTWTEWEISRNVISGFVVIQLLRPLQYQTQLFFYSFGTIISNMLLIVIPSFIFIDLIYHTQFHIGPNIPFFLISLFLGFLLSFQIDFITGLCSFYTQSIWGISMTKEVIILVLSGSIIPIKLFPGFLQNIVQYLPFPHIYNTPIQILITPDLTNTQILTMLFLQVLWVIVFYLISRFFFYRAVRSVTINGG